MVEEGCLHTSGGKCLGQNVAHATTRLEALHVLGARYQVRALIDDARQVDELRGKQNVKVILLGQFVRVLSEFENVLAIEVGLGIDHKERPTKLLFLHYIISAIGCSLLGRKHV